MDTSIRIPARFSLRSDLVRRIKDLAKRENKSVDKYVETILMDATYNTPNAKTRAAIESVERGEYVGTVDLSSIEAMIKSIEG